MIGTMLALGIIFGVLITLLVVRGFMQRRYVDFVFPIAIGAAVIVALLSLLTGHGLMAIGAAAILALGEFVGIVGTALIGGRVTNALDEHH